MKRSGTLLSSDARENHAAPAPGEAARERLLAMRGGEPLLLADWDRTLMLHYAVDPAVLQPYVPYKLDTRDGKAWVSLVAFTMRGLRPRRGGALTRMLLRSIATHPFLNVRTYVRHGGESGIYFLAEWLPNRLSVLMGRPVFGLPYRHGTLRYRHLHERRSIRGEVVSTRGRGVLRYRATLPEGATFAPSPRGSLTEFLMERYTAFTTWRGWRRCFRVWHEPWPQCQVAVEVADDSLLHLTGKWARHARFVCAHYSPGLRDVWMSRPTATPADPVTPPLHKPSPISKP